MQPPESNWLALAIGNTRLHWALFKHEHLMQAWHTPYLTAAQVRHLSQYSLGVEMGENLAVVAEIPPSAQTCLQAGISEWWLASVVPAQTQLWQTLPQIQTVQPEEISLQGRYPTLGADRLLCLWGAGLTYGWPALVVDAGTALTLTGARATEQAAATGEADVMGATLVGGAILPGLNLQLRALQQQTAALPSVTRLQTLVDPLPERWALNTEAAMQSGVLYTVLAGIQDYLQAWWQIHPASSVIFTGGDGEGLYQILQNRISQDRTLQDRILQADQNRLTAADPPVAQLRHNLYFEPHLIFWGMRAYRHNAPHSRNPLSP